MKTLIIALVAFIGLISGPAHAQWGIQMNGPLITTDQPGFILITTHDTAMETKIDITRIFSCLNYDEIRCLEYSEATKARKIILRFADLFWTPGDMFNFHIEHNAQNDSFKIQIKDFPNTDQIEVLRIDQENVSILTISRLN
jgi:hypothetical protein